MIRSIILPLLVLVTYHCSSQTDSCYNFDKLKQYDIVAFGEACHGSYSDYEARAEMIKCLIRNGGSVNVLIEMPHAAGIAVEKYYKGEIDSDSLLSEAIFYGLQTNSFLDFIDEFKGNSLIKIHGIDMQTQQSTLIYLKEAIEKLNPDVAIELAPVIDSLNKNFLFKYSDSDYLESLPVIKQHMGQLIDALTKNNMLTSENYLTIQYPIDIIQQHFKMLDYVKQDKYFEYRLHRDSCMAKNIMSLREYTNRQCIVLAANGHVMANNKSKFPMMGGHLKEKYGKNYFVITSQYYEGELLEVDVIDGKRAILQKRLEPPVKKALPYKIHTILKPQNDSLIFVSSGNKKMDRVLSKRNLGQDMGTGRGGNDYKTVGLIYFKQGEYDAVYFIQNVKPSVNLVP